MDSHDKKSESKTRINPPPLGGSGGDKEGRRRRYRSPSLEGRGGQGAGAGAASGEKAGVQVRPGGKRGAVRVPWGPARREGGSAAECLRSRRVRLSRLTGGPPGAPAALPSPKVHLLPCPRSVPPLLPPGRGSVGGWVLSAVGATALPLVTGGSDASWMGTPGPHEAARIA